MATFGIIGEIALFPYSFAPKDWARCDGSTLSIASNQALFSILGTLYGGDGVSNFQLPDLRDAVPVGASDPYSSTGRTKTSPSQAESGSDATVPPQLRMDWFICISGFFPSRW